MEIEVTELDLRDRRAAFIASVLSDFDVRWSYVLGGRYNTLIFRRPACAIIRIITLDIAVVENNFSCHASGGVQAWTHRLREWNHSLNILFGLVVHLLLYANMLHTLYASFEKTSWCSPHQGKTAVPP